MSFVLKKSNQKEVEVMKNYKVSKNLKNIIRYKIVNGKIKVYYSNGEKEKLDFSKEKEKEVLNEMKNQFIEYNAMFNKFLSDKSVQDVRGFMLSLAFFVPSLISLFFLKGISFPCLVYVYPLLLSAGASFTFGIKNLVSFVSHTLKIDDINKHEEFLENEEVINYRLNENLEILGVTSKAAKNAVLEKRVERIFYDIDDEENIPSEISLNDGSPLIDINILHSVSHTDLYKLLALIKEIEEQEKEGTLEPQKRFIIKHKK